MIILKRASIALFFWGAIIARPLTPSTIIALVDLTHKTQASYQTFIALNQAAGITVRYLYSSTRLTQALCGCDGMFLILDEQFLSSTDALYAQQVKQAVAKFARQPNKIIGLLLDESTVEDLYHELIVRFAREVLDSSLDDNAVWRFLEHVRNPMPRYPTSGSLTASRPAEVLSAIAGVTWLPGQQSPHFLRNTVPLAMMTELVNKNMLLIAPQSHLLFTELEECVRINPFDPAQRKTLLKAVLQTLSYVQKEIATRKNDRVIKPHNRVINQLVSSTPVQLTCALYKSQKGVYQWTSNGISCGWMGIDDDHILMAKNLAYVAQADFDMLWLELPLGIYQKSTEFDEKVSHFTKQLRAAYTNLNKPLPKIFIDFNLGAIAQWFKTRTHPVDVYATTYTDLPAPLDFDGFWHPAVLDVFGAVCKRWHKIGSGLPIDGVLINFYWWHTQQAAWYSNLMDFSDTAWMVYCASVAEKKRETLKSYTISQRIAYIIKNNLMSAYIRVLERQAQQLANRMIVDIRTVVPCAMLGAYTATPIDGWFYRGMMRGLGSTEQPLLWFTNNLNYYGHQGWIKKNDFHVLHNTNILLAHFNNSKDITAINRLAKINDGLWYSRASRIGQDWQTGKWWTLEATTMSPEKLIKLITKQAKKP